MYSFNVYTGKASTYDKKFGLGGSVVLNFMEHLKDRTDVHIYFDNFFTSYKLLVELKRRSFNATGTVRVNRTSKCPLLPKKPMINKPRGFFETFKDEETGIHCVQWRDTKPVALLSNIFHAEPVQHVRRYCRATTHLSYV